MTKATELLNTEGFRQAVAAIQKRAEKQTDWTNLEEVFVPTDFFDRVRGPDSQLILGRRGTGKTHLLRVFQKTGIAHGIVAKYIDCTILGSGDSVRQADAEATANKYIANLLSQIGTELHDEAVRLEHVDPNSSDSITTKLMYGLLGDSQNYRQIVDTLRTVLRDLRINKLVLVLDEWAVIPIEAQPFFAEHIKRAILSVPEITVKILAVNYQCQLSMRVGLNTIGLERGADLADVIDLDRYLVFDEKRLFVLDFFSQLLYNHLGIPLRMDLTVPSDEKRAWVNNLLYPLTASS